MTRNPFKILNKTKFKTYQPIYWVLWIILSVFIITTNLVPNNDPVIDIKYIDITSTHITSYTIMGFIITIIITLISYTLFSKQEYKMIYDKNPDLYYKTISPLIATNAIWITNLIIIFIVFINPLTLHPIIDIIINTIFIIIMILGHVALFSMIIIYMQDVYYKRKRNKKE